MQEAQTEASLSQEVSWSPVIKRSGDSRFLSICLWLCGWGTLFCLHRLAVPYLRSEGEIEGYVPVYSCNPLTKQHPLSTSPRPAPLLLDRGTEHNRTPFFGVLSAVGDKGVRQQIITQCSELLSKGRFPAVEELKSELHSTFYLA